MKLILLTGDDCDICDEAHKQFKKQFKREIDAGEAQVVNLDQDEAAQEFWMAAEIPPAPVVLLATNSGKVVSEIAPEDLLEGFGQASPAGSPAV